MKVYVVMAFSDESYSHERWVHAVYSTKEAAEVSLGDKYAVYDADEDGYGGYMISNNIQEVEVLQ